LKFFFGIQINKYKNGVYIYQYKYTKELLKKFNFVDYKLTTSPMHPTLREGNDITKNTFNDNVKGKILGYERLHTDGREEICFIPMHLMI